MEKEALLGGQTPFVTVQVKVFGPGCRLFTTLVAEVAELMVTPPPEVVQLPLPIAGESAITEAVSVQTVCEGATTAVLGKASRITCTFAVLVGQVPLDTRHWKTVVPGPKPVIAVVAFPAEVIVPVPLISDQVPVPRVGAIAASVAVGAQTV